MRWSTVCIFVSGSIGALAATAPLEFTLRFLDWRGLFVIFSVATIGAGALIFFIVPDKPGDVAAKSLREQIGEIGKIYRTSYFWRIVPLMFTCASSFMAVQGLWAAPWLSDVVGLDRATVANHLFVMAVAMVVGSSLSGVIAAAFQRVGLPLFDVCALNALWSIIIVLAVTFRLTDATYVLWAVMGFIGIQTSLAFAALAHYFPEAVVGRANTAANVLVFTMAFVYQSGIGMIIELWPADANGVYPEKAYMTAFLVIVATQVAALVWYLLPFRGRTQQEG